MERSRSRDSPTMRDMSPTRPLSPTVPFYESYSSTPERPEAMHEPKPELDVLQYEVNRREEHYRLRGMRPIPLEFMPHEEPRLRALQAAGLEFEHDDPAAQAPPPRPPLRDNPENHLPMNSIVFSAAWPESPPPAQPRRVARPILCDNQRVGTVYAAEGALVWQVMSDVQDVINTWSPPWSMPLATRYWREVATIHLPLPRVVRCLHPYDIRRGVWERFQEPRLLPVLAHGHVTCTVIASIPISLDDLQVRLARETRISRYWQLMALTPDAWVIIAHYLPMHIVGELDELEALREQQRAQRGGQNSLHVHAHVQKGGHPISSILPTPHMMKLSMS